MANPAETAYFSFQDRQLSNNVSLFLVWPRKVVVHTFLGFAQARLIVQELSKAITFCLTSYPGEISYPKSANRELSNDVSLLEVLPRKVALHTSSHVTPIEA